MSYHHRSLLLLATLLVASAAVISGAAAVGVETAVEVEEEEESGPLYDQHDLSLENWQRYHAEVFPDDPTFMSPAFLETLSEAEQQEHLAVMGVYDQFRSGMATLQKQIEDMMTALKTALAKQGITLPQRSGTFGRTVLNFLKWLKRTARRVLGFDGYPAFDFGKFAKDFRAKLKSLPQSPMPAKCADDQQMHQTVCRMASLVNMAGSLARMNLKKPTAAVPTGFVEVDEQPLTPEQWQREKENDAKWAAFVEQEARLESHERNKPSKLPASSWLPTQLRNSPVVSVGGKFRRAHKYQDATLGSKWIGSWFSTPLYFAKDQTLNRWMWSPPKDRGIWCWQYVHQTRVACNNKWHGEKPVGDNLAVLTALVSHEAQAAARANQVTHPPASVRAKMGTPTGGIYTVRVRGATPLYYRHVASGWQWSPNKKDWQSVERVNVPDGIWRWASVHPENKRIIDELFKSQGGNPAARPDEMKFSGFEKARNALLGCVISQVRAGLVPQLFIIGFAGNVGALTGGVEQVFDFSTYSVGRFAYGGLSVGTNMMSANVAGYAGWGWKGKSLRKNVNDAYKGWFNSVDGSVGLPAPAKVSIGGIVAFSSDSQLKVFAHQPVCDQVVTLAVSVGFGTPTGLPFSLNGASTNYVTSDLIMNNCKNSRHKRTCMAFWMFISPAGIGGTMIGMAQMAVFELSQSIGQ